MPDQIRIAYLISRYPATNHTFILREILALRSLGFDIQVIAIRGADRPADRMTAVERCEQEKAIVVLPFGLHFVTAHLAAIAQRPMAYLRGLGLALRLGRTNPRTALFHLIYFLEAVVAGHAAKKAGLRHIHTHFSSTPALIASRVFGFGLSMTIHGPDEFRDVVGFGMREKVAASAFVSTISQYARSQILMASDPKDWGRVEICRLGVDPSVFAPGQNRNETGEFQIICVGRLAPVKAQQILIGACRRLVTAGWRLRLRLVGSGPDESRLKEFATGCGMAEHVAFEGARNQDEVIALYRESDIFALASFAEGVPVVLMEAMAMEIPCVATWVNGVPELIRDGETGILAAPSDEEGLACAIERLMRDTDLRCRLGKAGRQQVLRNYDLQANAERLAETFRKYLAAE